MSADSFSLEAEMHKAGYWIGTCPSCGESVYDQKTKPKRCKRRYWFSDRCERQCGQLLTKAVRV